MNNKGAIENNALVKYLAEIQADLSTGRAREHTYRTAFKQLIERIGDVHAQNEPSRSEHGSPDFLIFPKSNTNLILCYAETKDLGIDLEQSEKTEQLQRYFGYSNLILTNYLEFRFFRNGERYEEPVRIADLKGTTLSQKPENFFILFDLLEEFLQGTPESIKNGKRLAEIMGGKARRIRDNVRHYLSTSTEKELGKVYETVKKLLVHDITHEAFSDMYAQTLIYGLFVARYHDESSEPFTRQKARDLIPPSNPFLRHFFDHIVGPDFDQRLSYIVNELCEVFRVANVQDLMNQYFQQDLWGEEHGGPDPVIHFYEDFLQEYDSELRKKMGAYYTPLPVVRFIVHSVDYLLEKEFGLSGGLSDTEKIGTVHKVQILDPAVGTGTFLNEIIRTIYSRFENQTGRWPAYVHHDLLPRLYGFELMMASYTIAHLKLSMTLRETGFHYFNKTRDGVTRLGIYLTNSLEEGEKQDNLFSSFGLAESIAEEAKQASIIKNEKPIMVVIGNPPYSISSSNKGKWITDLIKDYKIGLGEKKINLDDDYIKFIRFAEHFIQKNGVGIMAMITNNSFIDGITHRQMRKHLLETFDEIYIIDLHGNSKKKEKDPDGGKDENVFNIQQGVSISIFIRSERKKQKYGIVHHTELYGIRRRKFEYLNSHSVSSVKWKKLDHDEPYYFFVPKDFGMDEEYKRGFGIDELFSISNSGVKTDRDPLFIDVDRIELGKRMQQLLSGNYDNSFKLIYRVIDSSGYNLLERLKGKYFDENYIQSIQYRPFDHQWIYYDWGLISRSGYSVNKHIVGKENIVLLTSRSIPRNQDFDRVFVSNYIADIHAASDQTYAFPLYLYPEKNENLRVGEVGNIPVTRISNINILIARQIANAVGAVWYPVAEYLTKKGDIRLNPEDVFYYIYAVLYSPGYRKKYKEFLKIDFPRVPYPKKKDIFWKLVSLGRELKQLHFLETSKVSKFITTYPKDGSNTVEGVKYENGKVFINPTQYFGDIPESAWNFWIGGYQPAQKWLKDRKGRVLLNGDIEHYQKIIIALVETDKLMKEIDKVMQNF